ncbi:MAG: PssD/Cps14F family polysaccharide biosynthesis glycosyltransferase [Candidatus Woesearchaeota archaeon]
MNNKKICLIASAGGHLNEILEFKKFIDKNLIYIVTQKREDSYSLNYKNIYFIQDTGRNFYHVLKNIYDSFKIFLKEKPDIVISTGAGSALETMYIAKLFGKKVIFIESFSRFNSLSLTGKLIYPFADKFFVQWKSMLKYKKAEYIGQLLTIEPKKYKKEKKTIFLTVGTSNKPFDRLIKLVDEMALKELKDYKIFGQIGASKYLPKNFNYEKYLTTKEMEENYKNSEIVICHAGTGSIINALNYGCKVYVMPRLKKYGENVDDHQLEIAEEFERINYISTFTDKDEFFKKMKTEKKIEEQKKNFNYNILLKEIQNEK